MDPENIQTFLDEAENALAAIRGSVLIFVQDGRSGDVEMSLRRAGSLKISAREAGMEQIEGMASRIENILEPQVKAHEPLSGETSREILDVLAAIEAEIGTARMNLDDFSVDIGDFLDQSFKNLRSTPVMADVVTETEAEIAVLETLEEDEFEIDEEMIEIFREEADDLLRNINNNLGILANEPNHRDALLEIRRSAHTFKGSAGIVGLKKPSRLAHRVEDLLDHLAENQIDGTESIFELLLASTDCLAALTNGEDSTQLELKVARIYEDFDRLMALLTAQETAAAAVEPIAEAPRPEQAESPTQPAAQQNRSIVRVSLEKLDDLANIVRGLVTSRSVFEQRLAEFEQQVDELHNTTRRLQRSSSKLETDFEATMMGRAGSRNTAVSGASSLSNSITENEFDMLEFDRYTEFHQTTRELLETTSDNFAINSALDTLRGNLEGLFENQRRLIEQVQEKLQRIRMIEFGTLSARLNRTIRVTCEEEQKQADLFITGEDLEVDTQVLDSLIEPLMHLLRNAVAHGIESPDTRRLLGKSERGRIQLAARNDETHIVITIRDDGRGIMSSALKAKAVQNGFVSGEDAASMPEEQILDLIFQPGLTTAETVSQTAGRGVGMNVVRTSIERQQGTVSVVSEPQQGTTFTLRIPISLAVTRVLLVKANRQTFAFPLKLVKQIREVAAADVERSLAEKAIGIENTKYRLADLNELLGFESVPSPAEGNLPLLLLEVADRPVALIVDEILKPEEITIKPLGRPLEDLKGIIGATILGNGSIVPVLDMVYFLKPRGKKSKPQKKELPPPQETRPLSVMIVDDSPSVRHLNTRVIRNAGWNAMVARDGVEALEMLQAVETLPDIILTDVEMPRMDGYELLASLKRSERWKEVPVVMITSRASDKHRQKAVTLGVSEYLVKPYDDAKLLEIIRGLSRES